MSASSDTDSLQIRKYPNRRYYDTTRSRHVRLQDIRNAVQDGYTVCVRDSKSDDDITNQVLGQIVLAEEGDKLTLLPPDTLHMLIRSSTPAWRETMQQMTELFYAIDRQDWKLGRAAPMHHNQDNRPKTVPSKELLITHLQQHVDTLTARIGELRQGYTA